MILDPRLRRAHDKAVEHAGIVEYLRPYVCAALVPAEELRNLTTWAVIASGIDEAPLPDCANGEAQYWQHHVTRKNVYRTEQIAFAGPDGGWVNAQVLRANGGFA